MMGREGLWRAKRAKSKARNGARSAPRLHCLEKWVQKDLQKKSVFSKRLTKKTYEKRLTKNPAFCKLTKWAAPPSWDRIPRYSCIIIKNIDSAAKKWTQAPELMLGWKYRKFNSTSVFVVSVASEKMSNRSKIGLLHTEKCSCKVRAPRHGVSKLVFLYKT